MREFQRTLQSVPGADRLPANAVTFEAAAMEWLLLGLVELPPAGVAASGPRISL
jgi:hypothetical protein